jgi:hypothetical protein
MTSRYAALARAKGACVARHAAEQVPFINDQPLFRDPLPLPDTPQ